MNIIDQSRENFTMKELYDLTRTPAAVKLSDHVDETIEFDSWAIYEDADQEGEIRQLLSIHTPEGETYTTNSASFIREFRSIVDMARNMEEDFTRVSVMGGTSKAGRKFITAVLA